MNALWPHIRPHAGLFALALGMAMAGAAISAALFWGVGHRAATAIGLAGASALALPLLAFALLRALARYGERLTSHDTTFRTVAKARLAVFAALLRQDASTLHSADALERVINDVQRLDGFFLRALLPAAAALVTAVIASALAALLGLWAGPWVALSYAAALIAGFAAAPRARELDAEADARGRLRREVAELLVARRDVVVADQRDAALAWTERLDAQEHAALAPLRRRLTMANTCSALVPWLAVLGLVLLAQDAPPAALLAVGFVVFVGFELFAPLQAATTAWRLSRLALGRVSFAEMNESASESAALSAPMRLQEISFRHRDAAQEALTRISAELKPGTMTGLIGRSGAGKSTLLHLLAGHMAPTEGSMVCDRPLDMETRQVMSAFVAQRLEVLEGTIGENLLLGDASASEARCWQVLEAVDLADILRARDGLDTWCGETGLALSGGQARRLGLARALLANKPVLLLDEPTEGLDAATAQTVMAAVRDWVKAGEGRLAVYSTHDRTMAALADQTLILDGGRLVPDNTLARLMI